MNKEFELLKKEAKQITEEADREKAYAFLEKIKDSRETGLITSNECESLFREIKVISLRNIIDTFCNMQGLYNVLTNISEVVRVLTTSQLDLSISVKQFNEYKERVKKKSKEALDFWEI